MKRIFIIDHNILDYSNLEALFSAKNVEINGDHGYSDAFGLHHQITSFAPDLIIMDIELPTLCPLTLLEYIKGSDYSNHIPVMVYTNSQDKVLHERIRNKNADHFYMKRDYSPSELANRIYKLHINNNL